jgi:hypothetical protein
MEGIDELRGTIVVNTDLAVGAATPVYPSGLLVVGNLTIGAGGSLTVKGKLTVNGTITNAGTLACLDLECGGTLDNTGATALTVERDCKLGGTFTNTSGVVTIGGNCEVGGTGNLSTTTGNVTITGNVNVAGRITLSNTGFLTVKGNVRCDNIAISNAGAILTVEGNLEVLNVGATAINMTAAGTITVKKDLYVAGTLVNFAGATITSWGALNVGGSITNPGTLTCLSLECGVVLDNTGATALTVYGDCKTGGTLTNTTGAITIGGNCEIGGAGNLTTTAGAITINGKCNLSGAFTASGAGNTIIKGNTFIAGILTLSNTGDLTVSGNLRCDSVAISNAGAVLTVEGNCECLNIGTSVNMTAAAQVRVKKDLYCAGGYSGGAAVLNVYGKARVRDTFSCTTGSLFIQGDCFCSYDLAPVGAGSVFVGGNLYVGNDLRPTTASLTLLGSVFVGDNLSLTTGSIIIGGNLQVKGTTTVSGAAGSLTVYGDAELIGAVGATNGTATITIYGISRIYGAITATGTVTYKGEYPEQAVTINAINASETNFVILAPTTGWSWKIKDLVLKSADPGANSVLVRLYQLVNGVLTNTHTFTINTAGALVRGTSGGFALYFCLDDMFTKTQLADDSMKITVQASAGGPCAVTGSYKYSSGSMP